MASRQPLTAIRSNSIPAGGVTSLQSLPPEQVPAEIAALVEQMQPVIARFREASVPMNVSLDQTSYKGAGDSKQIRITSVGLGYRLRSKHVFTFNVTNTAATAATVDLSKHFPYNLLANTNIQINGGASVFSADGQNTLATWARTRKGFFVPSGTGLNPAICRVTFGAGLTPTATPSGSFSLSGYDSFSIAATTNNAQLTVEFYTVEKVAYSKDTLLGALPLQNNSVYAQVSRQLVGSFTGADGTSPFYLGGGVPATTQISINTATTDVDYDFWAVPSDPGLYAAMVNQSYQIQQQKALTVSTTGSQAFKYNFPQNQFLVAAHIFGVDGNNAPLAWNALPKMQIVYNGGSVQPITQEVGKTRAAQFDTYGADIFAVPGYRLWDGDDTSDNINMSDEAGWIDTYHAATPQLLADVAAGTVTTINMSVCREVIVAGAVQTIG